MTKYLVPISRVNGAATHIWRDDDTLCGMHSHGRLKRDNYKLVGKAENHPEHHKFCQRCSNAQFRETESRNRAMFGHQARKVLW